MAVMHFIEVKLELCDSTTVSDDHTPVRMLTQTALDLHVNCGCAQASKHSTNRGLQTQTRSTCVH